MSEKPTPIKFYTDTHIPKAVAVQLRNSGIDVIRCEEIGLANADDILHLEYATREGRVVITRDEDFLAIAAKWQADGKSHTGIMYYLPHIQGEMSIGIIVKECIGYNQLIVGGAGKVEEDIYNRIIYIS